MKEPFVPLALRRSPKKSSYGEGEITATVFYDQNTAKYWVEKGDPVLDSRRLPAFVARGSNKNKLLQAVREGQDEHEIFTILGLEDLKKQLKK